MKTKFIRKAIASLGITAALLAPFGAMNASALQYDPKVDYYTLMLNMAERGDRQALYTGQTFEKLRNEKIDSLGLKYGKTYFFTSYTSARDIQIALDLHKKGWSMEDWDWLSRIVNAEAGCDWMPDWVPRAVGSVVLNRVKDPRFPSTIKDVIYDPGQYGPIYDGSIWKTPTAKSRANALYILQNGKTLPDGVIGQNGNPTGPIHSQYYDPILGTTIYFHY